MADMVFNGSTLVWGGSSWSAVSGPHGNGKAPAGLYTVERRKITPLSSKMAKGFLDPKTGKGFFVPITPSFSSSRSGLGIHPDGKPPGTKGCIGITSNSRGFYDKIRKTASGATLTLEVK